MQRHALTFAGLGMTLAVWGCSDSSTMAIDGAPRDAAVVRDARQVDATLYDARVVDARVVDARVIDATLPTADAHVIDAPLPTADARVIDAHLFDARIVDARVIDAPIPDAAVPVPDARIPDAAGPTPDAAPPGPGPTIGGCPVFPAADPWNQDVLGADTDDAWTTKLHAHALRTELHPDFGDGFGIPINVVPMSEPGVPINFDIEDESDPGPYPFPASVDIEGGTPTNCGGDCHVLVVQQGTCTLWEAWQCGLDQGVWQCGSGAKFDMTAVGPGQRPKGWTSADAAGLAITPGLVRYDEVLAGSVNHAIRFTMHCIQDGWVYPASHQAVSRGPNNCPQDIDDATLRAEYPPMGTRVRLKASYPTDGMPYQARIVAEAMKKYGMILADNGSDYFFQGEDSASWDDDELNALKDIPGDQFDVLEMPVIER